MLAKTVSITIVTAILNWAQHAETTTKYRVYTLDFNDPDDFDITRSYHNRLVKHKPGKIFFTKTSQNLLGFLFVCFLEFF